MDRQQWNLLGAAGLGAGLMYVLDPAGGGRRRALARDKAVRAYNVSSAALAKSSRDLGNRSKGLIARARSRFGKDDAPGEVLEARVRSRLGRAVSHPGAIQVEASQGRVTLRGDVLAAELDGLLAAAQKVKGISEVDHQLAVHESPDGVAALQQDGESGRRRRTLPPAARLLAGTAGGALALGLGYLATDRLGRGRSLRSGCAASDGSRELV